MSLSTVVSTLKFGADTSQVQAAKKEFESFSKTVRQVGGAIVGIMAGRAVLGSIGGAAQAINKLNAQATALGTTTNSMQEIDFVASKAHVSMAQMSVGMKELALKAQQAANGNKELSDMFQEFDFNVKNADGSLKSQTELLLGMGHVMDDAVASGKDMIVLQKLMGRGAKELGPIFKQGSTALAQQVERYRELGGPASQRVIDASERFHERQLELKVGTDNLKQSLLTLFMDTLGERGVESFAKAAAKVANFTDNLDGADLKALRLGTSLGAAALAAGQLSKVLGGTISSIALAATAGFLLSNWLQADLQNGLSGGQSKLMDFAISLGVTEEKAISLFVKLQRLGTSFSDTFGTILVGTFRLAANEVLSILGGLAEGFGSIASFLTGGKIGSDVSAFGKRMKEEAIDAQKDAVNRIKESGDRAVERRSSDDRKTAFSTEARRLGGIVSNPNSSAEATKAAAQQLAAMNANPGSFGGAKAGGAVNITQNLTLSSTANIDEQIRKIQDENRKLVQTLETNMVLAEESI